MGLNKRKRKSYNYPQDDFVITDSEEDVEISSDGDYAPYDEEEEESTSTSAMDDRHFAY